MRITVFTSNQPRHLSYVAKLAEVAETVTAVLECTTIAPGRVTDFYAKSDVMQTYFSKVIAAERRAFGPASFSPLNVRTMAVRMGDVNLLSREELSPALEYDVYLVFGSSFLKGWLVEELIARNAVNIHMGMSPFYRGTACNFWALYDEKPEYVGATVHLLSKGLDNGPALFHVRPDYHGQEVFDYTMAAVSAVQSRIVMDLVNGTLLDHKSVENDTSKQIRYSRNAEFTDSVASDFLSRNMSSSDLARLLDKASKPDLAES